MNYPLFFFKIILANAKNTPEVGTMNANDPVYIVTTAYQLKTFFIII